MCTLTSIFYNHGIILNENFTPINIILKIPYKNKIWNLQDHDDTELLRYSGFFSELFTILNKKTYYTPKERKKKERKKKFFPLAL